MKKIVIVSYIVITTLNLYATVPLDFLGTAYGGWAIPMNVLNKDSICYCVGAGEDISFDLELIRNFGCLVFSFDPTPRAIKHIEYIINAYQSNKPAFINNSPERYSFNNIQLNNLNFFSYGVWDTNKIVTFYLPKNPAHVSASIVNLHNTHQTFKAPCKTIKTIMNELGHHHLDLLKLDIEGAEYRVIKNMLDDSIFPLILCVEFHEKKPFSITEILQLLDNAGYTLLIIHKKNNYTFMR